MPVCYASLSLLCMTTDKIVVHRLDQATSGLMVLARTEEALRTLVSTENLLLVIYLVGNLITPVSYVQLQSLHMLLWFDMQTY
jgi:16S rRNA U516 pseudouridylate synthase RsuA-like enzyme